MEFSTQVKTFWVIMATGIILGILFDTYRILRWRFRPPLLITSVTDLIYCLLAAAIAFAALLISNWGELRLYVVIALFSGLFFYYRLASRHVMKLIVSLFKLTAKFLHMAKKIVVFIFIRPLVVIIRMFFSPIKIMGRKYKCWYKRWRSPPPPPPPPEEILPP
ncbi:hypothetical protein SPSIL_003480 [Sporomusa silvacetica DSM 10669]|uniref:Spore cortex biosynthesis protein YabQ n=1 Tax=Sporomusa silvacetica DSM 10669 TaxID=1123289 RepID=A0ABZ3IFX8_9FIRM|nr:spore cortex biosynthesis protein YabQ [Sporomusa silvacetica]OZC17750.1 spore protein YabQ [Sporomusa silvacetica DSM 10669]